MQQGMQSKKYSSKDVAMIFTMISIGVVMILFSPVLWNHLMFKQWNLAPGTMINKYWIDPPQPLYFDTYFFNWTNPHEFGNKSIKPKFVELGPYRFQEYPSKVNITYHDKNSTVSYRKQAKYVFLPDQSNGKLTDNITSVNVVAITAANQAKSWNILKVKGVELGFKFMGQQIHLTKTASELMFDGYDDPMLRLVNDMAKVMDIFVPFDRFGFFYKRNDSSELIGDFNADTKASTIGRLRKWNFQAKTNVFEGSCGKLEGASSGELFHPGMIKNQKISVFSPDICRNVELNFEKETKVHGIRAKKFIGDEKTVDNGTKYTKNSCYCSGECTRSGLINVTSCYLGAPVFVSFPHFLNADPYFLNEVEGMNPVKEKHQFFITLGLKSPFPLEAASRFQMNVMLKPIQNINLYRDIPIKFMPILWFERYYKLSYKNALLTKIVFWIPMILQLIGLIVVLAGIYKIFIIRNLRMQENNLMSENKNLL